MSRMITFRATDAEWQAINWVVEKTPTRSGSSLLRKLLREYVMALTECPDELKNQLVNQKMHSTRATYRRYRYLTEAEIAARKPPIEQSVNTMPLYPAFEARVFKPAPTSSTARPAKSTRPTTKPRGSTKGTARPARSTRKKGK